MQIQLSTVSSIMRCQRKFSDRAHLRLYTYEVDVEHLFYIHYKWLKRGAQDVWSFCHFFEKRPHLNTWYGNIWWQTLEFDISWESPFHSPKTPQTESQLTHRFGCFTVWIILPTRWCEKCEIQTHDSFPASN